MNGVEGIASPSYNSGGLRRELEDLGMKNWWQVLKVAVIQWRADRAAQLAAALAYYTLFSIAPLLLIVVAVAGALFGDKAVMGHLRSELVGFFGDEGAKLVEQMIALSRREGGGTMASIVSITLLVYGASRVFNQLKDNLNRIWHIEPQPKPKGQWINAVRDYLLSVAMVFLIGLMLLVSLVLHSVLATAKEWLTGSVPGAVSAAYFGEIAASVFVTTLLFAVMLRYLPDKHVEWRHVWVGAIVTAILFAIGKVLFGLYISRGTVSSTYGAAGSVIVVLLWAYYSALIFFFGAEFTRAQSQVFKQQEALEGGP